MNADRIKRLAYWIWRGLPPQYDLDDITSEAILGALQAREGCEVIAAKRQIIAYLRRCNPGSRGTGRQCLLTVAWLPTGEATQERLVLDDELRGRLHLLRACPCGGRRHLLRHLRQLQRLDYWNFLHS